jgi:glycosyltransferase involved in cell wall biosynthesis
MPKVSVIIPTYNNRSRYLEAAIRSVRRQTFQDFEIVVVDDGSKDETARVVHDFADRRMRFVRHDRNRGEAAARNTGIRHATGRYVAFLDDDDEWLPKKLEKQVALLDRSVSSVGLVYTGFWRINGTREPIGQWIPDKKGDVFGAMCAQNWIGTPSTVLVRSECFRQVGGFDESVTYGADYDMWLRISRKFAVDYISEPLILYRVHESNMSSNYDLLIQGKEDQLRRYAHLFAAERKTYSRRHLSLGVLYCCNNQTRKGREAFLKAIRLDPFNPSHYFNFGLSLLGARAFQKIKAYRDARSARQSGNPGAARPLELQ